MIGLLISFCATLSLMIVVLVRTLREHPIFSLTDCVHIDWRLVSQHMFIINLLYTCVLLLSKSKSCQAYGLPRYVPPIPGRHPPSMRTNLGLDVFWSPCLTMCMLECNWPAKISRHCAQPCITKRWHHILYRMSRFPRIIRAYHDLTLNMNCLVTFL